MYRLDTGQSAPRNIKTIDFLPEKPCKGRLPPRRSRSELLLLTFSPMAAGLVDSSAPKTGPTRDVQPNIKPHTRSQIRRLLGVIGEYSGKEKWRFSDYRPLFIIVSRNGSTCKYRIASRSHHIKKSERHDR